MSWRYAGVNRRGRVVDGVTTTPPDRFVPAKYAAGWRALDVWPRVAGPRVGAIEPDADTGRRIWWAEARLPLV